MAESTEEVSIFDRMINAANRDLSTFLPLLLGMQRNSNVEEPEVENSPDRMILINPFTQGMMVIEGSSTIDALLGKKGCPPASRASIEAMPEVEIGEEAECVICLEEFEIGGLAKEMPCKHKFHCDCIGKWLGTHGTCPVCRYEMPERKAEDGEGRRRRREIWLGFLFGRSDSQNSDDSSGSVE